MMHDRTNAPFFRTEYRLPDVEQLHLYPRSQQSWDCNAVMTLEAGLLAQGYQLLPTRSRSEFARLRKQDRLIILYQSSSVVAQGDDWQGAAEELAPFIVEHRGRR